MAEAGEAAFDDGQCLCQECMHNTRSGLVISSTGNGLRSSVVDCGRSAERGVSSRSDRDGPYAQNKSPNFQWACNFAMTEKAEEFSLVRKYPTLPRPERARMFSVDWKETSFSRVVASETLGSGGRCSQRVCEPGQRTSRIARLASDTTRGPDDLEERILITKMTA
jgi:hypothetical protein